MPERAKVQKARKHPDPDVIYTPQDLKRAQIPRWPVSSKYATQHKEKRGIIQEYKHGRYRMVHNDVFQPIGFQPISKSRHSQLWWDSFEKYVAESTEAKTDVRPFKPGFLAI